MKSLIALIPLAVSVLADGKDDKGQGILVNPTDPTRFRVYCETSSASPYLHHVNEAADMVSGRNSDSCVQKNRSKSHCTKLEEGEGGRVSICGPDSSKYEIPCAEVAEMARAVGKHCLSNERARGYVYREEITFNWWDRSPAAWVEVSTKP